MRSEFSRRDLARRGLLAGAALAVPAGLASPAFGQEGEDTSDTDSEVLVGLIGYEQQAILAYVHVMSLDQSTPLFAAGDTYLRQDRTHVRLLTEALAKIGGKPKPPPRTSDVPGLTESRTAKESIEFLIKCENQVLAACLEGQKELGDPDLLTLVAQVCGNVGQHLVGLRLMIGVQPLPAALPSGSETR